MNPEQREGEPGRIMVLNETYREALDKKLTDYITRRGDHKSKLPTELDFRIDILSALLRDGRVEEDTIRGASMADDEVTIEKLNRAWLLIEDYNSTGGDNNFGPNFEKKNLEATQDSAQS